jgi:transposase
VIGPSPESELERLRAENAELRAENAELRAENAELRATVRSLTARVEELTRQVATLTQALTEAQRAGKRQAAPFRRQEGKADPQPPGRKPGHQGERRALPEQEPDRVLHGPPLTHCPHCGGGVEGVRTYANVETDLPPVRPVVTRFDFRGGWCPHCHKLVYAPHPEQTSTATGAAASHLGPRLRSFLVDLKHRLGVPYRKLEDLLRQHFDLKVSPGGIVQASYRLTDLARPTFEAVRQEVARSPLVHADETGWRVGRESWWVWVACTERFTIYRIVDHRSAVVIQELLGPDFRGRLFRDGWASYDKQLAGWTMLRCLLHLKHNTEKLLLEQRGRDQETPRLFLDWLDRVFALKKRSPRLSAAAYARRAAALEAWWDWMLEHTRLADGNQRNQGFVERMATAQEQILPILRERGLAAANNRAEQQIRPVVVIRKISAGNRSERGARTHEVLASLGASCRQQGAAFADLVRRILLGPPGEAVRFWEPSPVPS